MVQASSSTPLHRSRGVCLYENALGPTTGEWDRPGGWREAAEDEIERVFVHFGSTKVAPARVRRDAIKAHGRGKAHALHLVVPCKEKRNSDGEVARKKARITAADLVSNGRTARTFAANLAGVTSRLLTQLELGFPGARTVHKDEGGATKEVTACRMQAKELGHGPRAPTPLYLDATAVLHGTATEQVSREMKYLAAKLAIAQQARAHGKIRTMKIDESTHPAEILTKPLQGREFCVQAGKDPRTRRSGAAAAKGSASGITGRARPPTTPTGGGGSAARYEQLARGSAPWRGGGGTARPVAHDRGTWGHALSRAGFAA